MPRKLSRKERGLAAAERREARDRQRLQQELQNSLVEKESECEARDSSAASLMKRVEDQLRSGVQAYNTNELLRRASFQLCSIQHFLATKDATIT